MEEVKDEVFNGTITPEQVQEVADALGSTVVEGCSVDKLRNILDGNVNESPLELKENPDPIPVAPISQNIPSKILRESGITEEDAMVLFDIASKYDNKKFNVYEALTPNLKGIIHGELRKMGIVGQKAVNTFSRVMVENLIQEMRVDKEFNVFNDEITKLMNFPDAGDMYLEHYQDLMENGLIKKAEAIEQDNKEVAQTYRNVSKAYTDAYTLVRQRDLLVSDRLKLINQMNKNITKKFKKLCEDFDYLMAKSKYRCPSIELVVPALQQLFTVDEMNARKYVVMICKVAEKLDTHKQEDLWWMYHSVNNPVNLTKVNGTKTEFSKLMSKTMKEFLEYLIDVEAKDCEV